jgi:protein tyrosine/serine phosphatase
MPVRLGQRGKNNLLILWADEAQRFMTASEDGTSDYNCVDVIRKAGATIVAAAQSTTSLVPPLGNDKSKVLTLNLRNRMIFRSADEADAVQAADFLGKKRVIKRYWGSSAGKRNVNYSEAEEHKIKPHKLRNLRDHECVLVHCERGFKRVTLPPLESDGTVPKWFSRWRQIVKSRRTLPEKSALDLIKQVRSLKLPVKLLVVSMYHEAIYAQGCCELAVTATS